MSWKRETIIPIVAVIGLCAACSGPSEPPTGPVDQGASDTGNAEDVGDAATRRDAGTTPADASADLSVAADAGRDVSTDAAANDAARVDAAVDVGSTDAGADKGTDSGPTYVYDDPGSASGTRLRRMYLDGGSGAYKTMDFWDTQLGTFCEFRESSDGSVRCLPHEEFTTPLVFADQNCTTALHERATRACSLGWSVNESTGEIYRSTGASANLTGAVYIKDAAGTCRWVAGTVNAVFRVAQPTPTTDFVEGTLDEQPRTSGMTARYVDGADGSRALLDVVSDTYGYRCEFDEAGRCLPPSSTESVATRYTDDTCSDVAYGVESDVPPPLITRVDRDADTCPLSTSYYETGASVTPSYGLNGIGDCVQMFRPPGVSFYSPGAELLPTDLPQATESLEGQGALLARRWVDQNNEPLGGVHTFLDTTRAVGCDPYELPGGGFACAPVHRGFVPDNYYPDAACSQSQQVGVLQCPPATLNAHEASNILNCEAPDVLVLEKLWESGAEVSQDYFARTGSGSCAPRSLPDGYRAYSTATEITNTLPTLSLHTE